MKYIVQFGGGVTSAECLKRTIDKYGRIDTIALFADIGQERNEQGQVVDGECDDLYRFMSEVEQLLAFSIFKLKSAKYGPGVWPVFFKERFIANRQVGDPCSAKKKRKVLNDYIKRHYTEHDAVIVTGLDFTEMNRVNRFAAKMLPFKTWAPLTEEPIKRKSQLIIEWSNMGIEPPKLYEEGFTHNNCSGFCVKGGLFSFYTLWLKRRHVYLHHENQEKTFGETVGKYTILKEHSLETLRLRFESGYVPRHAKTGCGGTCMG